jgi:hypothetical protein
MRYAELGSVLIGESFVVRPPAGGDVLAEAIGFAGGQAELRPVFAVGPREGFQDAVLGFSILTADEKTNTDLFQRSSFPVLMLDALKHLAGVGTTENAVSVQPGKRVELRVDSQAERLTVVAPDGTTTPVQRSRQGTFDFDGTRDVGVYRVVDGESGAGNTVYRFAVNLFDALESDIAPRAELRLMEGESVTATRGDAVPARREFWQFFLILALTVLIVEWYIFNRRVYV